MPAHATAYHGKRRKGTKNMKIQSITLVYNIFFVAWFGEILWLRRSCGVWTRVGKRKVIWGPVFFKCFEYGCEMMKPSLKPFENYTLVSWILLFLTLFFYRRRCRNKVIKNTSSTYNRLLFPNFYNRTHDTHTLICYSKNSNIFQTKLDSLLMPFKAKKKLRQT